jgi:glutamate-1-semialdehyde 2,1-aminomutase
MSDRAQSQLLFERSQRVIPGGVHSPVRAFQSVGGQPIFIESAAGPRIFDVDGNCYLDFCMSWGPLIFGHADPDISAAAKQAIDRGSSFGAAEVTSLELAELIVREIPWVDKIRFVSSGTEAVMSAIRVARGATGRSKVLKFAGCYHGHADSMLVQAGSGLTELAAPDSAGVPAATAADTLVAPLDDLAAVEQIFAAYGTQIAAIIIEPVPANNGLLPQTPEFLRSLADIARAHNALLIFDEVITGFRLAFGGAAEIFGIQPDLVTYGKVLGGGFPAGAFAGRADLMDQVAPVGAVYQAGTLSGNPVAMAAGLATLEKLLLEKPYRQLEQNAATIAAALAPLAADTGLNFRSVGSMFWLEFDGSAGNIARAPQQIPESHRNRFAGFFSGMLEQGIYLAPSPLEIGFLSTAHREADVAEFYTAVVRSLGIEE